MEETVKYNKPIYFDASATEPVDKDVADAIYNCMLNNYGNPSSKYRIGRESKEIIADTQALVRKYIRAKDEDKIIFTSSGSEANTLALEGWQKANKHAMIFTDKIEHSSIINQPDALTYIDVDKDGRVDLKQLDTLLTSTNYVKCLVSIAAANNEIGTVQNITDISRIVHAHKGLLHVDWTQAFKFLRPNVSLTQIDMMTASFHKIGCPKGLGFLYVRDGIDLKPIIYGGQQQYGIRGGTEPVAEIAGAKVAVDNLMVSEKNKIENISIMGIRNHIAERLQNDITDAQINGDMCLRLPSNLNISFKGIDAESLILMLDSEGICVSAGSACNSASRDASHVLKAIGMSDEYLYGTIRITVGKWNTMEEADTLIEAIERNVQKLRDLAKE